VGVEMLDVEMLDVEMLDVEMLDVEMMHHRHHICNASYTKQMKTKKQTQVGEWVLKTQNSKNSKLKTQNSK
jgi:uncharacterized protein (DUF2344 family)